eukprot:g259.t1
MRQTSLLALACLLAHVAAAPPHADAASAVAAAPPHADAASAVRWLREETPLRSVADWLEEAINEPGNTFLTNKNREAINEPGNTFLTNTRTRLTATEFCPSNGAFEFIPVHIGNIRLNSTKTFTAAGLGFDECYASMKVDFSDTAPGGHSGHNQWGYMHFTRPLPTQLVCADWYIATSSFERRTLNIGTVDEIWKKMHINFTYVPDELADIKQRGVDLFVFPCGINGTAISIANTAALFYGSNVSRVQDANVKFLKDRGLFDDFVPFNKVQKLDHSLIKSGDNMQVLKLDGLDPLVAWGTGGRTGHTTILVWEGETLYVCESTDKSPFGSYWPPPYGVIRTPFEQWIMQAQNATFSVVVLPISDAAAKAFDEDAFWRWFSKVQGMPYGYHVMLYSFLDTHDPARNLPAPIDDAGVMNTITSLDRIVGHDDQPIGSNMYSLIIEGLNHRLQTKCTGNSSMHCIMLELGRRNMTLAQATAIPEQDDWRYDANSTTGFQGNYSMMCSAFVANSYKVALGDFLPPFNSHEFTPKDVYQLHIFNDGLKSPHRFTAANCPIGIIPSQTGNICQLVGPYSLPLNGYNLVAPYAHMDDSCAAQWPDYATHRPC